MTVVKKHVIGICLVFILGFLCLIHDQDANAQEANKKAPAKWLMEKVASVAGVGISNTTSYFYDEKERKQKVVISSQFPGGQSTTTTEYFYDEAGNNTKRITKTTSGKTSTEMTELMLYDSNKFLKKKSTTTSYGGQISTMVEEYENNDKGKPVKTVITTNNASPTITLQEFDECGNQTKTVVSNHQAETRYEYAKGKDCVILSTTSLSNNQLHHKIEFEYTPAGKLSKKYIKNLNPAVKGSEDQTEVFTYDENGNVAKTVQSYVNSGAVTVTVAYTFKKSLINR